MIKSDERDLLKTLKSTDGKANCLYDHIKTRRHERILEKWQRNGFWECGVSLRTGWVNIDHPSYMALTFKVRQGFENELP